MPTPPLFIHFAPGELVPCDKPVFTNHDYGLDSGRRKFVTPPQTPLSLYPQIGDPDSVYSSMFVCSVIPIPQDSTDIEIEVRYRGITRSKPARITPGCDTQIFTVPTRAGSTSGAKQKSVIPVPVPRCTRSYVTFTQPTNDGVGAGGYSYGWLPSPPAFSVTFYPDPDEPPTYNLITGWVLQSREWDPNAEKVWEVHEHFAFFYTVAL